MDFHFIIVVYNESSPNWEFAVGLVGRFPGKIRLCAAGGPLARRIKAIRKMGADIIVLPTTVFHQLRPSSYGNFGPEIAAGEPLNLQIAVAHGGVQVPDLKASYQSYIEAGRSVTDHSFQLSDNYHCFYWTRLFGHIRKMFSNKQVITVAIDLDSLLIGTMTEVESASRRGLDLSINNECEAQAN